MEEKFVEAAKASPYGMLIVNDKGTIKFVNPMMSEMFQYTMEEILKGDLGMLMPESLREKHREYIEQYFGNPISREMSPRVVYGKKRDGTLIAIEIGLSPILNNCEPCVLGIIQDVTDKVLFEKALEDSNRDLQRFRKFYDAAPIGFYRTCLDDGKFLMANPACIKMLGFSTFEEMQDNVKSRDLYPEEDRHKFLGAIQKRGYVCDYELELTLLNGKKLSVLISGTMCKDDDCIEGSITDISDKKEMKKKLEEYKIKNLAAVRQTGAMISTKLEEIDSIDCEPAA